ncbi:MAG: hypothetical protein AAB091_00935, partial [Elusimicrobiota bacterium]
LIVSRAGTGAGTVTSFPAGDINCGTATGATDCYETYSSGSPSAIVNLTATPDAGSIFSGWTLNTNPGGGTSCAGQGACYLDMAGAGAVTAIFDKPLLTIAKSGVGSGSVTSSPSGINCGVDCMEYYAVDTAVTLTAAADTGSTFLGWSGGVCAGSGATCVVTMNDKKDVEAVFGQPTLTLTVTRNAGAAGGVVKADVGGINCGLNGSTETPDVAVADCTENYYVDRAVVLTASAAANSTFMGWTGDCSGTGTCSLTMNADKIVGAVFNTYRLTVSKGASTGEGSITSLPAGINYDYANTDDSEYYPLNTLVTLTAVANSKSAFTAWSGEGCSGTGTCVVTMHANKTVTALFTSYTLTTNKTTNATTLVTGNGTVTSAVAGINCDSNNTDCTEKYAPNASVTLAATADADSTFMGWNGGGCSGTGGCTVTMDASKTISAKFDPPLLTLTVTPAGTTGVAGTSATGADSGAGLVACVAACPKYYTAHSVVTITATKGNASTGAWGGACSGTVAASATCDVVMNGDKAVTLTYAP